MSISLKVVGNQSLDVINQGGVVVNLPITPVEFQRNLLARLLPDVGAMVEQAALIVKGRTPREYSWTPEKTGHSFIMGVKGSREVMHVRPYGLQHQPYCVKGYV